MSKLRRLRPCDIDGAPLLFKGNDFAETDIESFVGFRSRRQRMVKVSVSGTLGLARTAPAISKRMVKREANRILETQRR